MAPGARMAIGRWWRRLWDPHAPASHRRLFGLVAAALLGAMLLVTPVNDGDAGEYLLMTESLFRHRTPDLRPADVASFVKLDAAIGFDLNYAGALRGYYDDPAGAWYSYHFWGYPAVGVPARAVMALLRVNGLRALPLTNAVLLLIALHQVLFRLPSAPGRRLFLFLILLLSPALWFVRWPHTEVLSFSGVTVALVWMSAGRTRAPILPAALAAMQNPPLTFLVACCWVRGVLRTRRPAEWVLCSLAALPAVLSAAFFLWKFGTPSLVAQESVSLDLVSLRRAAELVFDLNIGLLPYYPLPVLLFLVGVPLVVIRATTARLEAAVLGVLVPVVLASTVSQNWNHGTIGPSRYAVWMIPFLAFLAVKVPDLVRTPRRGFLAAVGATVVLVQAVVVFGHGGVMAEPDYQEHSYAARFVLRHAPWLYNPSPEIFAIRTAETVMVGPGPVVYRDDRGCRKALLWPDEGDQLRRICGRIPPGHERFLSGERETGTRRYIDYD